MQLSVLQWNVWFREHADNIASVLADQQADILCLQELTQDSYVNPSADIPARIAALGYEYDYRQTLKVPGAEYYHMGNGIFSKYPIRERRHVYLQYEGTHAGVHHENRVYLEITIETPVGFMTIGTAHLSFQPELVEVESQQLQHAIEHHRERYLFTGDLNVMPDTPVVKMLEQHLLPVGPDYTHGTWPTKPYVFDGMEVPDLSRRLDYLFATRDITVTKSCLIETPYSDHLPVRLELSL
jgi:endonuclease/exonuclease/phosphatase family metal-dependent hydrolase